MSWDTDMQNRPCGDELLEVARRVLLDELLPLLPPEKTYDVRMVANAMAIAARELKKQATGDVDSSEEIARFYRQIGADDPAHPSEATLARHIRERLIDQADFQALHALLLSMTQAKLAVSNPKYLLR
jgi:hypothetical protein